MDPESPLSRSSCLSSTSDEGDVAPVRRQPERGEACVGRRRDLELVALVNRWCLAEMPQGRNGEGGRGQHGDRRDDPGETRAPCRRRRRRDGLWYGHVEGALEREPHVVDVAD